MEFIVKHITRKDLDVARYDACIANAINTRIYAYSWYLDAVADQWDVLVYGDYEVVMPLPWRRKFFIHYIYTPAWVQQLGIFFTKEINSSLLESFLLNIPQKFKKINLMLNANNEIKNRYSTKRVNYILNLQKDFKTLFDNFKKNRRQSLKEATVFKSTIEKGFDIEKVIALHQLEIAHRTNLNKHDYENLRKLCHKLQIDNEIFIYNCVYENTIIGSAIFLYKDNRYYYIISAVDEKEKKKQSMSLILNQFIKDHAGEKAVLDFEGSMLPGVASFFRSFGTEIENYFYYQKPFSIFDKEI